MSNCSALGGLDPPYEFDDDFGDFEAVTPNDGPLFHSAAEATHPDSVPTDSSRPISNVDRAPKVLSGDACSCSKASQGDSTSQDSGLCTCNRSSPTGVSKSDGGVETEGGLTAAEREDGFDDFCRAKSEKMCDVTSLPVWKEEEEDDGFTDFADFSAAFEEKEEEGEWGAFTAGKGQEAGDAFGLEPCDPKALLQEAFADAALEPQHGCSEDLERIPPLEKNEAHERLWEGLHDLDQAASLRQQWGNSRTCQRLLRSLNIDSRNILRNPAVPLFATQLGLLEPQRGDSVAPERPPSPRDCQLGTSQESIPPAQFDWRSSGLVNPLEQPSSSSLLDLEFLSGLGSSTLHRMSSLEEEFLGDEPLKATPESPKLPPRLRQLLESGTSTLDTSGRPPDLSADAARLLDRLPDLSFMRATVLMFPVRL